MNADTLVRMQDRASILETILQLGRGLDEQDVDGCSACFTEDAQWDAEPGRALSGLGQIRAYLQQSFTDSPEQPVRTSHHLTNMMLTFHGEDEVHSETYTLVWVQSNEGSQGLVWGRWYDDLRRTHAGWRIATRTTYVVASENCEVAGHRLTANRHAS